MQPATDRPVDSTDAVLRSVRVYITEQSFWNGVQLEHKELTAVMLVQTPPRREESGASSEILTVIPELNTTLRSKYCNGNVIPEGGWVGWLGSDGMASPRIASDEYLKFQLAKFDNFVRNSERTDKRFTAPSSSEALFSIDANLKAARISEIRSAITRLYHRKLGNIIVSNFSADTNQINVLAPGIDKLVTLSVVRSCTGEAVEVGRELPLRSVRRDLVDRIKANGILVNTSKR